MSSYSAGPLYRSRVLALLFSSAFGTAAAVFGLFALVKGSNDISALRGYLNNQSYVEVNTTDIFITALIATMSSILSALIPFIFLVLTILPSTKYLSPHSIRLQVFSLVFIALLHVGTMIPYMIIFETRAADIKIFFRDVQISDDEVKLILGGHKIASDGVYRHTSYLQFFAIFPWFSVTFAAIAAGILFLANMQMTEDLDGCGSSIKSTAPLMAENGRSTIQTNAPQALQKAAVRTTTSAFRSIV